jgi:hypothetical protein
VLWGNKKFNGVTIVRKGQPIAPNEHIAVGPRDPLFYIGQVLKSLHVPVEIDNEPNQQDADLITVRFNGFN